MESANPDCRHRCRSVSFLYLRLRHSLSSDSAGHPSLSAPAHGLSSLSSHPDLSKRSSQRFWILSCRSFAQMASIYTVVHSDRLNMRFIGFHEVRFEEVFLGGVLALAVIEACRRAMSKWMAATISLVLIYLLTCQYWPGMFHFKAFSLSRAVEILYLSGDEGMFGFLTGISAEILYIYILFAAVMTATGTGEFLIDFATFAAGWARGGSAKISILSSALYGTMSGSTVANVYATGSFTIPLMKRSGFSPKESAAIEAISGTGGQIMPPIMGAGSFIMAEITGYPLFQDHYPRPSSLRCSTTWASSAWFTSYPSNEGSAPCLLRKGQRQRPSCGDPTISSLSFPFWPCSPTGTLLPRQHSIPYGSPLF